MTFLFPAFLWALFALAIPVIIHLFNFRRYKIIYFSNNQLLKDVKKETRSRTRLKNWLILLSRILMLLCLIFAFAQPVRQSGNINDSKNESIVGIYLDNSFSMDAESSTGKLLETAKAKVNDILNAYKPGTKFVFLTNDFENRHQHALSKDQIMEYLPEIQSSPIFVSFADVIKRMDDIAFQYNSEKINNLFILSDFQKVTANINEFEPDTLKNYFLIPAYPENVKNLFIDSIWFDSPIHNLNQPEVLYVKVNNHSDESYRNIPVNLFVNDSLRTIGSIDIEANKEATVQLSYNNYEYGLNLCRIEINDYPITYDNVFYFSYLIAEKLNVLIINNKKEDRYLNSLLKNDSNITYKEAEIAKLNYSELSDYNTIIFNRPDSFSTGLNSELKKLVSGGCSVVLIPSDKINFESYNRLMSQLNADYFNEKDSSSVLINRINKEDYLFLNVFRKLDENASFPNVKNYYTFKNRQNSETVSILSTRKGSDMFTRTRFEKGYLYCFAFNFDESNTDFAAHPFFIPSVYNIILNSSNKTNEYYIAGTDKTIYPSELKYNTTCNLNISDNKELEIFPDYSLINNQLQIDLSDVKYAGNYTLNCNKEILQNLSINYNRKESITEYYNVEEIENMLIEAGCSNFSFLSIDNNFLTTNIEQLQNGIPLWKYFIFLAIFFLLMEILVIRLIR